MAFGQSGIGDALELDAQGGRVGVGEVLCCKMEGWMGLALGEHTKEIKEKSGKIEIFWEE